MQDQSEKNVISLLGIFVWLLATMFFLYEFFLRAVLGTLASEIMPDLGLNAEAFGLLGSAYYITYAFMQVPVGVLTDKFGLKKILCLATFVCASSTLLFAGVQGFWGAFVARALMGFASSFAFICVLLVVANWLPKKNFAFFIGASQFIGTMGPLMAGGPLAALLVFYDNQWRTVTEIMAAAGFVLFGLIFLFVRNKSRDLGQDSIVYLQKPGEASSSLGRMVRNSQVWAVATFSGCIYVGVPIIGELWGTPFLQACGFSLEEAASTISLLWFGYAIGCLCLGAFSDLIKRRKVILFASALLGLVASSAFTYIHFNPHWVYMLSFFALGLAASGQSVAFAAIVEHAELSAKATALGLNNAFITAFPILLPPITGYLIGYLSQGHHLQHRDFVLGFSVMPVMYVAALLVAIFWIKETYCKPQKETIILQVG